MAVVPCNTGFTELAKLGAGEASDAWTHIELGTGTTTAAATATVCESAITTNGLEKVAATMTSETTTVTDDTIQATKVFTATGTTEVKNAGVFNQAATDTGDMLMYGNLSPTAPMVSGDTLTLTMKCQIKAAA